MKPCFLASLSVMILVTGQVHKSYVYEVVMRDIGSCEEGGLYTMVVLPPVQGDFVFFHQPCITWGAKEDNSHLTVGLAAWTLRDS